MIIDKLNEKFDYIYDDSKRPGVLTITKVKKYDGENKIIFPNCIAYPSGYFVSLHTIEFSSRDIINKTLIPEDSYDKANIFIKG